MGCSLFCKALILFVFQLLFFFYSVSGKLASERTILLGFKSSVFDPSGVLSSWNSSDNPNHCTWFGVSCNSRSRVISINIPGGCGGNFTADCCCSSKVSRFPFYGFGLRRRACSKGKLVGNLSPLVGKLTELRVLSLAFNDIGGEIPLEIWGLENLEELDLEGNSLTGKLPDEIVGLRNLRVLNLGFNELEGGIPGSLSKFVDLEVLNLAGNKLKGSMPGYFGGFYMLKGLYLSNNQLNGPILENFGRNCRYLEYLDLSGNFLVGRIPGSLGNCRRLRTLLLFSNMLDGVIPNELGQLQELQILDVSRNKLNGLIPAELGNCVRLSVLVLSNLFDHVLSEQSSSEELSFRLPLATTDERNRFRGSIPLTTTTLPKLRILWVPRANLEGELARNWHGCENLEIMNLAQNNFSGEIFGVFNGCKKLQHLDLSSNRLTGQLDDKLPVPCMSLFDISGNLMSGSIPRFNYSVCPGFSSLSYELLQTRDLSSAYLSFFTYKTRLAMLLPFSGSKAVLVHNFGRNNFSGSLPRLPIASTRTEDQIDYAFLAGGNKLTGSIQSLFGNCNKLHGMIANVSKNRLSGHIPLGIGAICRSLRYLDASENQITGILPQSLRDLKSLVFLDLSGNKLRGSIPEGLHQLKYLKHLSLASNNLTGSVPSSFGRFRSLEVLEHSPNSLSGEIPRGLAYPRNPSSLQLSNNKLFGETPSGFSNMKSPVSGSLPLNANAVNYTGVHEKPFLHSHYVFSLSIRSGNMTTNTEGAESGAASPSGNTTNNQSLDSIEVVSIASASAIVLVLLVLVVLFFYTRKWVPPSRVQVSESREITAFVDIGIPLTYETIVQATGNFSAGKCIGSGGFGATYKAEIAPETVVAVKRLAAGRFQGFQQFHAEVKTLETMRHPNLVTLIGYHASETEMFLIYNYFSGGNLENFIKERSARAVDWKIIHKIALDIACALAYLHDQCTPKVLHRDVKPSNILLDDDCNAYLSDFGLSRLLGTSETHATTGVAGTFGYVAPEYAMTCRVSEKADVYSYGVVLLELISDKKVLDPSFSAHANGFNIVSWACMMLRQGQAKDVFTTRLWENGPHDHLVELLHLAITCTVDSLSTRPTMRQVVHRLKRIRPVSAQINEFITDM
ncbi:TOADSTOOL 2, clv3 peptide insensitive 1, receptor-like protein kinase 2 [Hibiscus trionum]|uniref:non-specific serine/threonine protein kinase n=1 Tax=Hibiscus trionum TaxID=183268 RepID=A0A9W7ITQ0_HIBTR|nr:TOADSTOOL 2, clv3 peptide insensitive 1, receptor-like protein kinase 2 [Hibiscus trionum]